MSIHQTLFLLSLIKEQELNNKSTKNHKETQMIKPNNKLIIVTHEIKDSHNNSRNTSFIEKNVKDLEQEMEGFFTNLEIIGDFEAKQATQDTWLIKTTKTAKDIGQMVTKAFDKFNSNDNYSIIYAVFEAHAEDTTVTNPDLQKWIESIK